MTKDEFIDGYVGRTDSAERTPNGMRIENHYRIALPCTCGDKLCDGWAMISDDPMMIADHMQFYAPPQ